MIRFDRNIRVYCVLLSLNAHHIRRISTGQNGDLCKYFMQMNEQNNNKNNHKNKKKKRWKPINEICLRQHVSDLNAEYNFTLFRLQWATIDHSTHACPNRSPRFILMFRFRFRRERCVDHKTIRILRILFRQHQKIATKTIHRYLIGIDHGYTLTPGTHTHTNKHLICMISQFHPIWLMKINLRCVDNLILFTPCKSIIWINTIQMIAIINAIDIPDLRFVVAHIQPKHAFEFNGDEPMSSLHSDCREEFCRSPLMHSTITTRFCSYRRATKKAQFSTLFDSWNRLIHIGIDYYDIRNTGILLGVLVKKYAIGCAHVCEYSLETPIKHDAKNRLDSHSQRKRRTEEKKLFSSSSSKQHSIIMKWKKLKAFSKF